MHLPLLLLSLLPFTSPLAFTLPQTVKSAVADARICTQSALTERLSRMLIDFPVGTDFSVEPRPKGGGSNCLTPDTFDRSDREAAFLFKTMFEPLGEEAVAVCFRDEDLAVRARKEWGGGCEVLGVSGGKKEKTKGGKGFMSAMSELEEGGGEGKWEGLPAKCECAIFVAPGDKEIEKIRELSETVGEGVLIIILNSYLSRTGFPKFEDVYSLVGVNDAAGGIIVHHQYKKGFLLATRPKGDKGTGEDFWKDIASAARTLTTAKGTTKIMRREEGEGMWTNEEIGEVMEGWRAGDVTEDPIERLQKFVDSLPGK